MSPWRTHVTPPSLAQAAACSPASGKRLRSSARTYEAEGYPRLSLVTALPLKVWQDHLSPFLSIKGVVGLRGVCKALRGVVEECPVQLQSDLPPWNLEAALRCFPATTELNLSAGAPLETAEESALVELLRGHGGTLKEVWAYGLGADRLLSAAVIAGALPKLNYLLFPLEDPVYRQILSGGTLRFLESAVVTVMPGRAEHIAALEPLRRLPHLQSLRLECGAGRPPFPPFIPPSLKNLILEVWQVEHLESLLRELPSMLQASDARLEEIELSLPRALSAGCTAALAQLLQACSYTLKTVKLRKQPFSRATGVRVHSRVAAGPDELLRDARGPALPHALLQHPPRQRSPLPAPDRAAPRGAAE
jgi:hypothetical protein